MRCVCLSTFCACLLACAGSIASEYIEADVESIHVPEAVPIAVLLPPNYQTDGEPYPLVINLHGGRGNRNYLKRIQPVIEGLWRRKLLPPMVFVTPSVSERCFYMDYRDGTEKWESFVVQSLVNHMRNTYNVSQRPEGTFLTGISMGGMGSLRMAFKHPKKFAAVAALEPGIEPVFTWHEVQRKHRFWRADRLMHAAYGDPVDANYWAANNPAAIVRDNAQAIRDSGLKIYLECGDEDMFWLYEGTEFLHRILYNMKIRHEYHLVYAADHLGPTVFPRFEEALLFFEKVLNPPVRDATTENMRKTLKPLKLGISDHYEVD